MLFDRLLKLAPSFLKHGLKCTCQHMAWIFGDSDFSSFTNWSYAFKFHFHIDRGGSEGGSSETETAWSACGRQAAAAAPGKKGPLCNNFKRFNCYINHLNK